MAEFGRSRVSTKFYRSFPLFSTCTAFCSNLRQSRAIWGNLGQFACADYLTGIGGNIVVNIGEANKLADKEDKGNAIKYILIED